MIKDAVHDLLQNRDGLICGICNGFLPYGRNVDADENAPTLTFNIIGRHQSWLVRTRVVSVKSPWFAKVNVGDVFVVPISHDEERFLADEATLLDLIRTQAGGNAVR